MAHGETTSPNVLEHGGWLPDRAGILRWVQGPTPAPVEPTPALVGPGLHIVPTTVLPPAPAGFHRCVCGELIVTPPRERGGLPYYCASCKVAARRASTRASKRRTRARARARALARQVVAS